MHYELSFLTPILDSSQRDVLFKEIEKKIANLEGKIEDKFIEKKFFAYPVKKHREGFLGQLNFSLEKSRLSELQQYLSKRKDVIRTLLEQKKIIREVSRVKEDIRKPVTRKIIKKDKVKIEELDKKLEEILE